MRMHYQESIASISVSLQQGGLAALFRSSATETGLNDPVAWREWEVVGIFHSAQCIRQTLVLLGEG
jgi:hypothetical protein